MEVLRVTRQVYKIYGICSLPEESDFRSKLSQMSSVALVLTVMIAYQWSNVHYFVEHLLMGDIENSLFASIQVIGLLSLFTSLVSLNYKMKTVFRFFETLQNLYDECKDL